MTPDRVKCDGVHTRSILAKARPYKCAECHADCMTTAAPSPKYCQACAIALLVCCLCGVEMDTDSEEL